jgi:hypothetical protein
VTATDRVLPLSFTAVTIAVGGSTVTTFEEKGTVFVTVVAEIVACCELATVAAVRLTGALLWFAGTVTDAGIAGSAAGLLLVKFTVSPPIGAFPLSTTVPAVICPETTLVGLKVSIATTGGLTARAAEKVLVGDAILVTVIFAISVESTICGAMLKVPLLFPAGIVSVPMVGVAAFMLSLVKLAVTPPVGAGPVRITVPTDCVGAVTEPGAKKNDEMVGGITVRVAGTFKLEPELADTVTAVDANTLAVVTVNVPMVLPAGTVAQPQAGKLTGSAPAGETFVILKLTNTPPAGAVSLMVTVPVDWLPPTTFAGINLTWTTGGGRTVTVALVEPVPPIVAVAVTVTGVAVPTAPATIIND